MLHTLTPSGRHILHTMTCYLDLVMPDLMRWLYTHGSCHQPLPQINMNVLPVLIVNLHISHVHMLQART